MLCCINILSILWGWGGGGLYSCLKLGRVHIQPRQNEDHEFNLSKSGIDWHRLTWLDRQYILMTPKRFEHFTEFVWTTNSAQKQTQG